MTEYLDRYPTMHEYAEGKRINPKLTDLISRADAINAFWEDSDIRTAEVRATLKELPSADAVSRDVYEKRTKADEEIIDSYRQEFQKTLSADAVQGEWIRKVKEYNDCDGHRFVYWYECSVCGARPPKDTFKNEWHSDYCPSCGAIMKGGAE